LGATVVTDIEFRVVPLRRGPGREDRVVRGPLFQPQQPDEADGIADPDLALVYKYKRKRATA
jgi:hypothetical protein